MKDGQWVSLTHTDDGHWVATNMGEWPTGPIDVRMTAANGQVLYDGIPGIRELYTLFIFCTHRTFIASMMP